VSAPAARWRTTVPVRSRIATSTSVGRSTANSTLTVSPDRVAMGLFVKAGGGAALAVAVQHATRASERR
jgi:hypothetical protein